METATKFLTLLTQDRLRDCTSMLQSSDVKTWINIPVDTTNFKNTKITQGSLKIEQVLDNENIRNTTFETALGYTCTHGTKSQLQTLLRAGADVSVLNAYENTCFHKIALSAIDAYEKFQMVVTSLQSSKEKLQNLTMNCVQQCSI